MRQSGARPPGPMDITACRRFISLPKATSQRRLPWIERARGPRRYRAPNGVVKANFARLFYLPLPFLSTYSIDSLLFFPYLKGAKPKG